MQPQTGVCILYCTMDIQVHVRLGPERQEPTESGSPAHRLKAQHADFQGLHHDAHTSLCFGSFMQNTWYSLQTCGKHQFNGNTIWAAGQGPANGLNLPSSSDSSPFRYNTNCTQRYYRMAETQVLAQHDWSSAKVETLSVARPVRTAFKPMARILPARSQGQMVPDFRTNPA